jgi:hypothetical protein
MRLLPRTYKEESCGNQVSSVWESVKKRVTLKGGAVQRGLEPGSRGIAIVRSRFQGTADEDNPGWKRLSVIL